VGSAVLDPSKKTADTDGPRHCTASKMEKKIYGASDGFCIPDVTQDEVLLREI